MLAQIPGSAGAERNGKIELSIARFGLSGRFYSSRVPLVNARGAVEKGDRNGRVY